MTEEWRDVPGYEGKYQVSNTGLIRNTRMRGSAVAGRALSGTTKKTGYKEATLSLNGVPVQVRVHRLVMAVFVGACPDGSEVHHINGIKTDNRLENLQYVTHQDNMEHARKFLSRRSVAGTRNPKSKLNDDRVREMRRLSRDGFSSVELAKQFGVANATVWAVVKNLTWKHVTDEPDEQVKEPA